MSPARTGLLGARPVGIGGLSPLSHGSNWAVGAESGTVAPATSGSPLCGHLKA